MIVTRRDNFNLLTWRFNPLLCTIIHASVQWDFVFARRLLDNTETIERSGRKLNRGQQLLEETRAIGASVLEDLSSQGDAMRRARNRLRDTQDDLSTGSRILSNMIWRVASNKLLLFVVAAVIITLIGVVLYMLV